DLIQGKGDDRSGRRERAGSGTGHKSGMNPKVNIPAQDNSLGQPLAEPTVAAEMDAVDTLRVRSPPPKRLAQVGNVALSRPRFVLRRTTAAGTQGGAGAVDWALCGAWVCQRLYNSGPGMGTSVPVESMRCWARNSASPISSSADLVSGSRLHSLTFLTFSSLL